jgi:hypothetical protein
MSLNHYDDGKVELIRRNDGFDVFELLGLISLANNELAEQLRGNLKPDVIKREVIKS